MNTKYNKINIQLKKGNAVVREIELSNDDADLIYESIRFYWLNAERFEKEMLDRGCNRLRNQAFYMKKDLEDVLDKLR